MMTIFRTWKLCLPILIVALFVPDLECGYVVLAPKTLSEGSQYKVVVSIDNARSDVSVSGTLTSTTRDTNTVITASSTIPNGGQGELNFQIPQGAASGSYNLSVNGEGGLSFTNNTSVLMNQQNVLLLIQTDKGIYKPSQVVKIRVLGIDSNYKVVKNPITISIMDNNNNKLQETRNIKNPDGVALLEYPLSDEPPFGDWTVEAKMDDVSKTKTFKVDEYVLPKFEVKTELSPPYLKFQEGVEQGLNVKVTASYVYGKDVVGEAKVKIVSGSVSMEKTAEISGSTNIKFNVPELVGDDTVSLYRRGYYFHKQQVDVYVNVTERPTMFSIVDEASAQVYSYTQKVQLEALNNLKIFRAGSPFKIRVKVTDPEGQPLSQYGMKVKVECSSISESKTVTINGPEGEVVTFSNTDKLEYITNLQISGKIEGSKTTQQNFINMIRYNSNTNATVQVTDSSGMTLKTLDLDNTASVSLNVKTTGTFSMIAYAVVSKGNVVSGGILDAALSDQSLTLTLISEMSPMATLVVYATTDGKESELIVDVYDMVIDNGMGNKVSLAFSSAKERAGTDITLNVKSDPNSAVYILGVDKSVQLLAEGNDITQESLAKDFSMFTGKKTEKSHPQIMFRRKKRTVGKIYDATANTLLTANSLIYMTDNVVAESNRYMIMPVDAMEEDGIMFKAEMDGAMPDVAQRGNGVGGGVVETLSEVKHVRNFFPETWLFLDGKTSVSGDLMFESKVPDTITTWYATAFSVSPSKGLGIISKPAELVAFQPFFVSLNLPYSIVRGENFELIVAVFNYMDKDVSVLVTLERSENFGARSANSINSDFKNEDIAEEIMVKQNTAGSVSFRIQPSKVGDQMISVKAQPRGTSEPGDQVKRTVVVKPEGFKMSNNTVLSVDINDGSVFEDEVSIWYPKTVVRDSKGVQVQITGDVMGPALEGLETLLRVPMGCGEQTMLYMVPNIFVTSYLEAVNKLTNEIKSRAFRNMQSGYERELKFKHSDGSFSAFQNDKSGSTWLTAFVLKSFSQASNYITIDTKIQTDAFNWLYKNLKGNGEFNEPGRVIHQEMLGGTGKTNGLTAFVLIAMLESKEFIPATQYAEATSRTISHLENLVDEGSITKPYEKAIVAYALTLAKSSKASILLQQLKDGKKPWIKQPSTETGGNDKVDVKDAKVGHLVTHPPKATSSDVETWAYVILAYTENGDFGSSQEIVRWLFSQQNPSGGFHSTQDTVVGLQALASYGKLISNSPKDLTVEIMTGAQKYTKTVNRDNALILQSIDLPDDTTDVRVRASGVGMAIVKVQWRYYTKEIVPTLLPTIGENKAPIVLKVATQKVSNHTSTVRSCVSCETDIGMSLIEVGLASGHSLSNMEKLSKNELVRRTEVKDETVVLYLDKIPKQETCFDVEMTQVHSVENIQEAPIKATAYYQTELEVSATYSVDVSSKDFCDLCGHLPCAGCPGNRAAKWSKAWAMALAVLCVLISFIFAI